LDASVLGFNGKLLDMESYRSLDAWKHAHAAVILVHKSTQDLNRPKYWAILDQLRRAVISVETNIVEGYALKSQAQLLKHLWIAFGSAAESECLVRAVAELGYLDGSVTAELESLLAGALRTLRGLLRKPPGNPTHSAPRTMHHVPRTTHV
jgi:four helix bundle protein